MRILSFKILGLNLLNLLILGMASITWFAAAASTASAKVIKFNVPNGLHSASQVAEYRLELDEANPELDRLFVRDNGHRESFRLAYAGPITSIDLPTQTEISDEDRELVRGRLPFFTQGDYAVEDFQANGLRFRSGNKLIVLDDSSNIELPWPGQVERFEKIEAGADAERYSIVFAIYSVQGKERSGTYLVINDDYEKTIELSPLFRVQRYDAIVEGDRVILRAVKRAFLVGGDEEGPSATPSSRTPIVYPLNMSLQTSQAAVGYFQYETNPHPPSTIDTLPSLLTPHPTAEAVKNELVEMLTEREEILKSPNSRELVETAIRHILWVEFPGVESRALADEKVRVALPRLVNALSRLWEAGILPDAQAIQRVLEIRLESNQMPGRRIKCALALNKPKGVGSHTLSYYQSVARRELNLIYRHLYR